jgi:hypothetical protein
MAQPGSTNPGMALARLEGDASCAAIPDSVVARRVRRRAPANGCVTLQTFSATYVETESNGTSTLTWTFTSGSSNVVSRCFDPATNREGTAMTSETLDSYIAQGMVPPRAVTYTVSSTSLVLNPSVRDKSGLSNRAVFTKKPD